MRILPTDFEGQSIRRVYDEATDTWWFSVIDIVQVLTGTSNARRYWSDLKRKLAQEAGSEQPYAEIVQLQRKKAGRWRNCRRPAFCVCAVLQLFHHSERNQASEMVGCNGLSSDCGTDYDDGFSFVFNETFWEIEFYTKIIDRNSSVYLHGNCELFKRCRS